MRITRGRLGCLNRRNGLEDHDEILILACEALQERADFDVPDFSHFQAEWTVTHIEDRGLHVLSFWQGPAAEAMVLLTEGRPPERRLASIDHRPHARRPILEAREGSFLHPGVPFPRMGRRLAEFGIFGGWWPGELGARRLRLTRCGKVGEIEAASGGFILVDWDSPAPVERFDAVEIEGVGWTPTILPELPCTSEHLFHSYRRFRLGGMDWSEHNPDLWSYDLFSIHGAEWFDAVVAFLRHADPDRDFDLLTGFGAQIYANDHAYYDRMERELKAGTIKREVLGIVLSMEKPEFMEPDLRLRHQRLAARC